MEISHIRCTHKIRTYTCTNRASLQKVETLAHVDVVLGNHRKNTRPEELSVYVSVFIEIVLNSLTLFVAPIFFLVLSSLFMDISHNSYHLHLLP